jgi:DNA-binding HxlR family transcriptional regulator
LQDYNIAVKRKRKVSTLLCHSYLKETIVKKRGFFMGKNLPACPVETTLMLISDRWKVLIIRDLLDGTKRFGEIKKSIGNVSQKVLTANLRSMENSGLLTRKVYPEVPPRVEYTLTETGYSLKPVLDAMVAWGTEYKQKNG